MGLLVKYSPDVGTALHSLVRYAHHHVRGAVITLEVDGSEALFGYAIHHGKSEATDQIVALFIHQQGTKRLVASSDGDGFIVLEDECLANTRKGKQVLNVKAPAEAQVCCIVPESADHIASIGENRKLVIFPA